MGSNHPFLKHTWLVIERVFERLASLATRVVGSTAAVLTLLLVTVSWVAYGWTYGFQQDHHQWIGTVCSLLTVAMLFLLQREQNKAGLAVQAKLNELLVSSNASNRLIAIENLSEAEVRLIHDRYQLLALRLQEVGAHGPHSVEELIKEIEEETEREGGNAGSSQAPPGEHAQALPP
jgi:low affinity Fe/Cu permease